MAIEVFAPAKINLTLHITGQRDDGYHLLDSLVVFADVGDRLTIENGAGLSLSVKGPMSEGVPADMSNSVLQAAAFLGQTDLSFTLEKNLPSAAGIGGGTSDAAAALRAVSKLRDVAIPADVTPLGADVPVCLTATASRMSGIGDIVQPVKALPRLHAVLVNPGVAVSTPEIFKGLSRKSNPPMPTALPQACSAGELAAWLTTQRNDLEAPAISAQPIIADVLSAFSRTDGQLLARMSGSGATCFALYEDRGKASAAARSLRKQHPRWWVVDCQLN